MSIIDVNCHPEQFVEYVMKKFQWSLKRNYLCLGININDPTYRNILDQKWKKKALIIINPAAFHHEAEKNYNQVEELLEANGFDVKSKFITKQKGDAFKRIQNMPRDEFITYYQVICCGGDGLVHEVINGFYMREDHHYLNLRLGSLVGGEASSMAINQSVEWKLSDKANLFNTLWGMTRGRFKPINICRYSTDGNQPLIYGFNNFEMGFLADVVSHRQKTQSTYKAAMNSMKSKAQTQEVQLIVSEHNKELPSLEFPVPDQDQWKHYKGQMSMVGFTSFPFLRTDFEISNRVHLGEHTGDMLMVIDQNNDGKEHAKLKGILANGAMKKNTAFQKNPECFSVCKNFRIKTAQKSDVANISIDGELYNATNVQMEFVKNRVYQTT